MSDEDIEKRVEELENRLTSLERRAFAFSKADVWSMAIFCIIGIGLITWIVYFK